MLVKQTCYILRFENRIGFLSLNGISSVTMHALMHMTFTKVVIVSGLEKKDSQIAWHGCSELAWQIRYTSRINLHICTYTLF